MARARQISKPPATADKPPAESIKETIDSIVIALVLALVFRAFIVEAFVIPTGSMADTLLGEHRLFVCPNCGYSFPVGVDSRDGMDTDVGLKSHPLFCQNCKARFLKDDQLLRKYNPDRGGDKILVFKFPYLFANPDRWDVVVFYNPANPEENFIKRLIGRPGETIQIVDGDIFVGQDVDDPTERAARDNAMKIQRKPELVQQTLWWPVYLNDYLPNNRNPKLRDTPMWLPAPDSPGWAGLDRVLRFNPADDVARTQRIDFVPAVVTAPVSFAVKLGLTDYVSYNGLPDREELLNVVWDLRLEFVVFFEQAGGQVAASMNHRKTDDPEATTRFNAVFHQDGRIELTENGKVIKTGKVDPFPVGRGVAVAFQNVDYYISVIVNNRQAIGYERQPDLARLRMLDRSGVTEQTEVPRVWIEASGGPLELRHVNLLRDVYYTSRVGDGHGGIADILRGAPGIGDHSIVRLKKHSADQANHDEFFVLGDNSPASSDGRLWTATNKRDGYWHLQEQMAKGLYRFGRVPRDHLIGRAFFVYWPAALPVFGSPIRLVPNVGDMRLIH